MRLQPHQAVHLVAPSLARMSLAIAPVGGWLAVTGAWSEPWWLLLAIAVGVATWVAGSTFSTRCRRGLRSRLGALQASCAGPGRAILLAKVLHGVTIPALALSLGRGVRGMVLAGLVIAACILTYEISS